MLLAGGPARALDPHRAVSQYGRQTWQVQEGLPQNSVNAIVQAPDDFLWIGTEDGLVRFDGVKFTVYDRTSADGLRNNNVQALAFGALGELWIGTAGGLTRYASGAFTTFTTADGLPRDYVSALQADSDGTVWIGTVGGGWPA
jgi:ligand-binding sensor domain-containing protein